MAQWDNNYVFNSSNMNENMYRDNHKATIEVVIGSMLTVWIVSVNTLLICAILMTKSLRQRSSNWLLVNLALADLLVGLLVTSFAAYQRGHNLQWELSHHVCVFWLLFDILLGCVSMYMLIVINIDRFVFISLPGTYPRKMTRMVIVALIAASWVVALCIVLPFFFRGRRAGFSIKKNIDVSEMCYIELLPRYSIASAVLTYFVPGALLVALTALTFRAAIRKVHEHHARRAHHTASSDINQADSNVNQHDQNSATNTAACAVITGSNNENSAIGRIRKTVFIVCVINAIYLAMWLPFFFINVLSSADMYHVLSPKAFDVAIWLAYANSGVNPLIWLLYPDVFKAFSNLLRCRFDRNKHGFYLNDEDTDDDVPITTNEEA